jgi:uncharacterized protein (DUF433 family)
MREYVEERDGGYSVAGKRVSLDSIVAGFHGGESPETIQQHFPVLTLEEVYGAITFCLANQDRVDRSIREGAEEIVRLVPHLRERKPEAYARLMQEEHARDGRGIKQPAASSR